MNPFESTLLAGLLGGTLVAAVLAFAQFLITRSDQKKAQDNEILAAIAEVKQKVADVDKKIDVQEADGARRNVLAFDDELRRGVEHSEESFNQILDDIKLYRNYCRHHDDYENSKATASIAHIELVYQRVKNSNSFI